MEGHLKIMLLIISVLATGRVAALSLNNFKELKELCFPELKFEDWKSANALSVENFIYMIEKIERMYRGSTADLIQTLLNSFSCNRLDNNGPRMQRDQNAVFFEHLMAKYLQGTPEPLALTPAEKCQLFFLLSPAAQIISESDTEKTVYGFGVLSVSANPQAIDMSKVLYGILAGLKNEPLKLIISENIEKEIDFLYASTVSEVTATAVTQSKEFTPENYANEGNWTSNMCTKQYQYVNDFKWPVTAEILGAVDGFRLGLKMKNMKNRDKVKLSQILRMYYSRDGFRDDTTDQNSVSYCNKEHFDFSVLQQETTNYLLAYKTYHGQLIDEPETSEDVKNYLMKFNSVYRDLVPPKDERCKASDTDDICETPSNVFVILDKRSDNITLQKSVTGELINAMNIGLDEDTITIYANEDIENLHVVVNASDSKADASCALEGFNPGNLPAAEDSKVLTDVKNIMTVYKENQKSLDGVPAKVVVYFNFGELKEDRRILEKARRALKSQHPHLKIIPIGNDKSYLEYFTNNQPSRVMSWLGENLVPNLKDKICLAPAVLQHSNCKTKSKYENNKYIGYIGNRRIHHWAMYPQHFLKTFSYKFQFKAQYGKIRVCFSRSKPIEHSDSEESCKETSGVGEPIEFSGHDPCKGRTVHNCDAFYFSIFGREDEETTTMCYRETDDGQVGCKRTDLIEYTIKHEGIACSSGIKIISSPFLLLAFLVIFYVLSQQK